MARRRWLIIHLDSGVASMKISSHVVKYKDIIIQQETGRTVSPIPKGTGFSSIHTTGKRKRYKKLEHWLNMSSFNVIPGGFWIFHNSFLSAYEKFVASCEPVVFSFPCHGETWQGGLFQFCSLEWRSHIKLPSLPEKHYQPNLSKFSLLSWIFWQRWSKYFSSV